MRDVAWIDDGTNKESSNSRPNIVVTGAELTDLVEQASDTLVAANDPPQLFVRGDVLVRIVDGEFGPETDHHVEATLRVRLDQVARWEKVSIRDGKAFHSVVRPDRDVISYLLAKKEYEQLPRLDRIITAPILAPDGSLVIDPGYDPATRTYLKPADGLQNLKVPEVITKAKRKKALRFILEEFLVDFPFASEADRANAVSLFLLPFVRELIPGLVPAYLFDASKQGSGKGLLAKTLLYPGIGKVALTAEKGSAEEYRKHITSHLISSPTVIGYDNLTGDFGNGALAGALTMDVWEDRILGISRNMKATVRNLWVLTGNNLRLTGDMPRRIVLVRLVPKEERPDERPLTEFHQEDLPDWVHRNRHKLVLAALYLCEAWVQEGMPRVSEPIMGSYPEFSSIMGGILQVCELDGFLLNRAELRAAATPEENETAEFLRAWYEIWGATPVLARDVATELEGLGLAATIPTALTPYVYTGRLTKQLSYFLRAKRDGVFGGYQLHAHVPSGHSRKWWVEKVDEEEA